MNVPSNPFFVSNRKGPDYWYVSPGTNNNYSIKLLTNWWNSIFMLSFSFNCTYNIMYFPAAEIFAKSPAGRCRQYTPQPAGHIVNCVMCTVRCEILTLSYKQTVNLCMKFIECHCHVILHVMDCSCWDLWTNCLLKIRVLVHLLDWVVVHVPIKVNETV